MDMKPIMSFSGMWRLPALLMLARYGDPTVKAGYSLHCKLGKFRMPGMEGAWQFWSGWEREVKALITNLRNGFFVDIGANIGVYTIMAARNGNQVLAVEPNLTVFKFLMSNVKTNMVADLVDCIQKAAYSHPAHMALKNGRHADTARLSLCGTGLVPVECDTLDNMLHGRIPDLIKMDAEGSEPAILEGMPETLFAKPAIIFEALTESALHACNRILWRAGYKTRRLDRTNFYATA